MALLSSGALVLVALAVGLVVVFFGSFVFFSATTKKQITNLIKSHVPVGGMGVRARRDERRVVSFSFCFVAFLNLYVKTLLDESQIV